MARRLRELALAVAGVLVISGPAVAAPVTDNIVPTGSVGPGTPGCTTDPDGGDGSLDCLTDNATVYYYMDSGGEYELESEDRHYVQETFRTEFSPTDLEIHYDSNPTFSGSGETDIIYQEGSTNLDSDSDGVTWCNDGGDPDLARFECDQQYIRIRGNGTYSYDMACHETGHAVGLTHGSDAYPAISDHNNALACMTTSPVETWSLGSSNTQNINAVYNKP
ncbi:hypothetical protein ACYSUO_23260 [Streptomyces sp. UC4497]